MFNKISQAVIKIKQLNFLMIMIIITNFFSKKLTKSTITQRLMFDILYVRIGYIVQNSRNVIESKFEWVVFFDNSNHHHQRRRRQLRKSNPCHATKGDFDGLSAGPHVGGEKKVSKEQFVHPIRILPTTLLNPNVPTFLED